MSKSPAANKQAEMKLQEADQQMKDADKLYWLSLLVHLFSNLFYIRSIDQPRP